MTLGPYAVALSRVIEYAEKNRQTLIQGQFTCYRGIGLPIEIIQKWCNSKIIALDGYNSSSLSKTIGKAFAYKS
jgi:hypothetical protein